MLSKFLLLTMPAMALALSPLQQGFSSVETDVKGIAPDRSGAWIAVDFTDTLRVKDSIWVSPTAGAKSAMLLYLDSSGGASRAVLLNPGGTGKEVTLDGLAKGPDGSMWATGKYSGALKVGELSAPDALGRKSFYLLRLDSAGKPASLWAQPAGPTSELEGKRLVPDSMGRIWVWGKLKGAALSFGTFPLEYTTVVAGEAGFVARFNAEGKPDTAWTLTKTSAGKSGIEDMELLADGGFLGAGKFEESMSIGGKDPLVSTGAENLWVARFDGSWKPLWSFKPGAPTGANKSNGKLIRRDTKGQIWVAADFENALSLDEAGDQSVVKAGKNAALIRLDSAGKPLQGIFLLNAGAVTDEVRLDALEATESAVWTAGKFTKELVIGGKTLKALGGKNSFIACWNLDGTLKSVELLAGTLDVEAKRFGGDGRWLWVGGSAKGKFTWDGAEYGHPGDGKKGWWIAKMEVAAPSSVTPLRQAQGLRPLIKVGGIELKGELDGLTLTWLDSKGRVHGRRLLKSGTEWISAPPSGGIWFAHIGQDRNRTMEPFTLRVMVP